MKVYTIIFQVITLLLTAHAPLSASAFSTACGNNPVIPVCPNGWAAGEAIFHTAPFSTTGSGLNSAQLESAFTEALDRWSNNTNFEYKTTSGSADPCPPIASVSTNPANNDNGYSFDSVSCFSSFASNTLAIATTFRLLTANGADGAIIQSGVVFNSAQNWDIYSGPQGFNTSFDFTRVAVHEVGHSLGLNHSNDDSAIMWATITDTEAPQSDDLAGVAFLYGALVIPNFNFGFLPAIYLLLSED